MAIESSERLLTVAEVAALLHVHPITVRRQIKGGRIPCVRIGRSVRVRARDVTALAERADLAARLPYRWPPTREDTQRRRKIVEQMRALRESMAPMDTTELVRASRRELEERNERWLASRH